jgi:hypothetical protein
MISIYNLNDKEVWASIIKKFDNADVYYLPDYVKAFQDNGDGEAILIHYLNKDIEIINVVIKRDIGNLPKFKDKIRLGEFYDFTTPYGYGGFLVKGSLNYAQKKAFIDEYNLFFKMNNVISEFQRISPLNKDRLYFKDFINIIDVGATISVNTIDKNEAWKAFSSKNKSVIRKSISHGIKVSYGYNEFLFDTFKRLYLKSMDSKSADPYYYFSLNFFVKTSNTLLSSIIKSSYSICLRFIP